MEKYHPNGCDCDECYVLARNLDNELPRSECCGADMHDWNKLVRITTKRGKQ